MKKLLAILTTAFWFFLQPLCVLADNLDFAVSEFTPYIFEENGKITGIHVDIVTEACKKLGIKPNFHFLPWKRALVYMEHGKVDALLSPVKTEERIKFMYYSSEPIDAEKTVFMARKDKNMKVAKLDDLKGISIGVIRGYSYSPEFDNYEGLKKEDVTNAIQLMKKLDAGRTDLVIGEEGNLKYIRKKYALGDIKTVFILTETPNYIGFSKKALGEKGNVLADKFGQVLHRFKENGVILKIRNKYF